MIYRRRIKSDVWHFVKTCRWWPTVDRLYLEYKQSQKPSKGELCNECRAKAKR